LRARAPARRTLAVFGMLSDKDARAVADQLDPLIDHWLLCGIEEPRGLVVAELRARLGTLRGEVQECATVADACQRAVLLAQPGDRVLVCGSFHVVGPALDWLGL
jgi:dihydrofolate synthase/folylpolyglutamate synthase